MSTTFGAGFHAAPGKTVDASAYERWTGRWSRLFIPAVLAAAGVGPKCRVSDDHLDFVTRCRYAEFYGELL